MLYFFSTEKEKRVYKIFKVFENTRNAFQFNLSHFTEFCSKKKNSEKKLSTVQTNKMARNINRITICNTHVK